MVCSAMGPPGAEYQRPVAVVSPAMDGAAQRDGLWAPHRRALTLGLVLSVTFVAVEALAVITVMPVVARDLNGLALYGWVFSTFQLASLIGIVVAGRDADRHGPARPYVAGLVLFSAGLLVAGLAPSMWVLVAGRCLQGLGAGAVPAVAYVAIGRSLREVQRARMMAVLSTAWVVPGILGPGRRGRGGPPVRLALGVPRPAAARGGGRTHCRAGARPPRSARRTPHRRTPGRRRRANRRAAPPSSWLHSAHTMCLLGLGLAAVGALVGWASLRRLLPPGTLRAAPGLPATILSRGLLTFAFFGADAYVTLTITTVRHHSIGMAGAVVTASTLAWTVGLVGPGPPQREVGGRTPGPDRVGAHPGRHGRHGVAAPARRAGAGRHSSPGTAAGLGMGLSYAPTR